MNASSPSPPRKEAGNQLLPQWFLSIITNPATDPHDYEATPQDARRVASADYVIVNGIGYDAWARNISVTVAPPRSDGG